MKKILFILLFTPLFVHAQIPTRVAANIILNNAAVTNKTSGSSIHPSDVGYGIDSAYVLIDAVYNLISSGGASLQGTLNTGFFATNSGGNTGKIQLQDATYNYFYGATYGYVVNNISPSFNSSALSAISGNGILRLGNISSGYFSQLTSTTYTNSRFFYLPDEPTANGSTIASGLVSHTTQYPIVVTSSGDSTNIKNTGIYSGTYAQNVLLQGNQLMIYKSGLPIIGGIIQSTKPAYLIKDIYSGFYNLIVANVLDSSVVDSLPLKSGTLATLQDVANGGGMLGLDGVLTNNSTSNQIAFFGKATGLNPYSSAYIRVNNDSSGDIGIQDTSGYQSFEIGRIFNSLCMQTTNCDSSLHLNGAWIITPPSNTSIITLPQNINGQLAQIDSYISVASDANYTATNSNEFIYLVPSITATRTLSIPQGKMGQHMIIKVLNITGSFNWNISVTGGGNINDHDGSTITSLSHETVYTLYATGSSGNWMILNKY